MLSDLGVQGELEVEQEVEEELGLPSGKGATYD